MPTINQTIVYDADGNVINIGPWNYRYELVWLDENDPSKGRHKVAANPLPDGAREVTVPIAIPTLDEIADD